MQDTVGTKHKGRLSFELLVGLGLRGGGAVASFALTFVIARQFGADVVGLYQIGLTTATLVSLGVSLGLPLILVREAVHLLAQGRRGDLATSFYTNRRTILLVGLAAMAGILLLAWPLGNLVLGQGRAVAFILVTAPLVILLPVLRLHNELLRSLGSVWLSQSLEGIFYTSLTAGVIALLWLAAVDYPAILIPLIYLVNVLIAFGISRWVVSRKMTGWGTGKAQYGPMAGLAAISGPFVMMLSEWAILFIVGTMLGLSDAGIYRTVVLICSLFQLVTASFATMAGPHLARARSAKDRAHFYSILRLSGLLGLGVCAIPAIAVFAFPEWILGLFGEEFRTGATALTALAIAQLLGVANGPTAPATLMLGQERINYRIEIVVSFVAVGGALVLIGPFGLEGAAFALLAASIIRAASSRLVLNLLWRKDAAAS